MRTGLRLMEDVESEVRGGGKGEAERLMLRGPIGLCTMVDFASIILDGRQKERADKWR